MIAIIDYGLGNIRAFANVYSRLNMPHRIASSATELEGADKLILPGVGAFDSAMRRLNDSGLRATLDELVLDRKVPILGVCVGMQMFAASSEEGACKGLGWIEGVVRQIDVSSLRWAPKLPHMGWNTIEPRPGCPLFEGLDAVAGFYFLHSYYMNCTHESQSVAVTDYGGRITCAVQAGNVHGVQFHPEKSHENGVRLLANFGRL